MGFWKTVGGGFETIGNGIIDGTEAVGNVAYTGTEAFG